METSHVPTMESINETKRNLSYGTSSLELFYLRKMPKANGIPDPKLLLKLDDF